ncbi:MAG TPA: LytR C-terminal domain-containing protein [Mycobacterium sp.]|nr:LytR C-terminal domain-containing protein [Mycobacterium sp.]MCB0943661.1 LytR C-terminal domain-containing protein [Mycobacterium sp.]TXI54836.1 MAG: LytR family transcriptional regulator [Mycobacterium sp.]HMZ13587.1 LytR C-terminal domain-containing protein [Mycobacterium sp.]HNF06266.1 LytR C-terminal domain-containing protein [Mycobacterium sp.]
MNERVPDSSGLPLRAMVMVLLFLGVIFLLVGFQAMGSGNDSSDDSSATTVTTTTSKTTPAPAPKADVRVFNVSSDEGVAARTGDRLREAGWNVTETGNLTASEVTATTVYYGTTAGEQAAAEAVAKVLDVPVQPRIPEIAEQPPGVIVLVTG